jgi:hypothetical protein
MQASGVPAAKARLVVKAVLRDIGRPHIEIFPKHARLVQSTCYGNFINVPLFEALVPQGRTVFVDPANGLKPYADQWSFLEGVRRIDESCLDQIIELNKLSAAIQASSQSSTAGSAVEMNPTFGLPPCARQMLTQGVTRHQRVACFRLAVQLKKAGIPEDITVASLIAWAAKNRPADGRRTITEAEIIEQTCSAYQRVYRSCGCEDPAVRPYCAPTCPLSRGRHPAALANDETRQMVDLSDPSCDSKDVTGF